MAQADLRDRWIAIGLSEGILPETATGAVIGAYDLAVWRGKDGDVRVWENRCPHRGMRLSHGFVRGNRLSCIYHGWSYDGDAACAAIPAHPDLKPPKTIKATKFNCEENAGMVWATASAENVANPGVPGHWLGCRSIALEAPAEMVSDLFAQMRFPLTALMANGDRKSVSYELQTVLEGAFVIRPYGSIPFDAILCAVQPIDAVQTMLHVAVSVDKETGSSVKNFKQISNWMREIRHLVEAPA